MTEEGIEYLINAKRLETTEPDRKSIREFNKQKEGDNIIS